MNHDDQKTLLETARQSIADALKGVKQTGAGVKHERLSTLEHSGVFVTLKIGGHLRGCIGSLEPNTPLLRTVAEIARKSAFADPRFGPLQPDELDSVEIEISVLTPFTPVGDHAEIEIGRDGLMIESGYARGLLLPQVATEYSMGREEFVEQTCLKAGLSPHAWKKPGAKLYRFSAEVFSERAVLHAR